MQLLCLDEYVDKDSLLCRLSANRFGPTPARGEAYERLTPRFKERLGGKRKGKKDEDALNCGKEIYRGSET